MPVTVRWYNENQDCLLYSHLGAWRWQELSDANQQALALLDTINHQAASIIDVRKSPLLPANVLSHRQHYTNFEHRNFSKLTVFVGASPFIRSIANMFQRIYHSHPHLPRFRFADTVEEAYAMVLKDHATIQPREQEHAQ